MNLRHKIRTALLLIPVCLALVFSLPGCSSSAGSASGNSGESNEQKTSSIKTAETKTNTKEKYDYPALDYGGKSLKILNSDVIYNIYMYLDKDTQTGEILDDAVYKRNRLIEDKFNCKIAVTEFPSGGSGFEKLTDAAYNIILAGDDEYDVMYLKIAAKTAMISEGCLYNLYDIPELKLSEPWWDRVVIDAASIGGKLYFATSNLHLMPFESAWCVYFNEELMKNYKLDAPYDMVRDGKWTIDEFAGYCKAAANLNGDDSYAWNKDGRAFYGVATHTNAIACLMYGADIRYTETGKDGYPAFSLDNQRFYDAAASIAAFTSDEGAFFKASTSDWDADKGGYIYAFANGRAMFLTGQIKTSQQLRDMEDNYGLVPFPKYDETQDSYYTYITGNNLVFTVPVTNKNADQTGTIIDALTYCSYADVIPVYYEATVSQKGLRNENSIEMLDIIRATRGIDIADYFGWNSQLAPNIQNTLRGGSVSVASIIASSKTVVDENIKKTVDEFKNIG